MKLGPLENEDEDQDGEDDEFLETEFDSLRN